MSLGSVKDHLKETYASVTGGSGPSDEEVRDAFATLGAMWSQVADSVGTVLRDPQTRDHLKDVAGSFAAALGTTLSQLGDAIDQEEE